MRTYNENITLEKNRRGVYILDTIKGCGPGLKHNKKGCYGDCYAASNAKCYGFDFSKSVKRNFKNQDHKHSILKKIDNANTPFIRIGNSGDPSIDWDHTIKICNAVLMSQKNILFDEFKKDIVIITKHWNKIPEKLLKHLEKICINTSISALDSDCELNYRFNQFCRLKNICKSILRINSCDYNGGNEAGKKCQKIQKELFCNSKNIDTIFRFSLNNPLVKRGVVNIKKIKFLNKEVNASVYNKKTYFGDCENCPDQCGVNL